jgi:hypothetical protein
MSKKVIVGYRKREVFVILKNEFGLFSICPDFYPDDILIYG